MQRLVLAWVFGFSFGYGYTTREFSIGIILGQPTILIARIASVRTDHSIFYLLSYSRFSSM